MNNTLLKGPLPYNYERDFEASGYSFGFVTLQKVRYIISFKLTDYLFENVPDLKWKTYEFIISPVFIPPGIKPKKDERIPVTVAAIFYSFYKELPNDVVIYICDSSDRKERIALDPKQPDRIDFCVIMKLDNPHKFDIIYSLEKFKADVESDK
jgi:hypothetical protein